MEHGRELKHETVELPVLTERLSIRVYRDSDLEHLFRLRSNPNVVRLLYGDVLSREETRKLLGEYMAATWLREDGDKMMCLVERRTDGAPLGNVKLQLISRAHLQGEIGYAFDPAYQGQGYAVEASRKMLEIGFSHFGLHRIQAGCDARNTASWKVMEKLGMTREAHFRESEFFKGVWADDYIYAILAAEWQSEP